MTRRLTLYAVLTLGIIAISFGAILIRLTHGVPVIAIAVWRLGVATLLLLPLGLQARYRHGVTGHDWWIGAVSGAFLALHFLFWISSLEKTSVASSVVLVDTSPIFVGLGAALFLHERPSAALRTGIILSVTGAAIIGWGDFRASGGALVGDFLALTGAVMAAGYLILGRYVRPHIPLLPYLIVTYGMAALVLLVGALAAHVPIVGFASINYLYLICLAVGPQLVGHSTFNWALRYLSAGTVAVITLGEPIGATVLAYLLLGERVHWLQGLGAVIILIGIYLSLRGEGKNDERPRPSGERCAEDRMGCCPHAAP